MKKRSSSRGSKGKPIVVIGSINMDLVCRVDRIARPGETILGTDLVTIPGGKGANQAVAAARLSMREGEGAREVHMVGRLGDDDFGARLLNGLTRHGVRTKHVTITEGVASGCAMILVDSRGENSVVAAAGANARLRPADVDAAEELIQGAACVVLQLEIPLETVGHAIKLCRRHGVRTILDPAPVPEGGLSADLYGVDILTPNQTEAELLIGQKASRPGDRKILNPKRTGMELLARGPGQVVLKLGSAGALIVGGEGHIEAVKPFKAKVVDTTAAGDAFTGGLAAALAEGRELRHAVGFANAAGALCCQTFGAQPALPTRAQVEELMS